MNRELMLKVADAIEFHNLPRVHFDMNWVLADTDDGCGTAACIAGHVLLIEHPEYIKEENRKGSMREAAELLGLHEGERLVLFTPVESDFCHRLSATEWDCFKFLNRHPKLTADALRWMANNDRIHWGEALDAVNPEWRTL